MESLIEELGEVIVAIAIFLGIILQYCAILELVTAGGI